MYNIKCCEYGCKCGRGGGAGTSLLKNRISRLHKKSESTIKKHECPICGTFFDKKNGMKLHISKVHLGQKFKCDLCDQAFVRIHQLNT